MFKQNVSLVVEIRANVKRPTISPLILVTMKCVPPPDPELVFREQKRVCDDLGICRVESIATLDDNSNLLDLFTELRQNGRGLLNRCDIVTKMLIDGAEVVRTLPGKFTLSSSGQY